MEMLREQIKELNTIIEELVELGSSDKVIGKVEIRRQKLVKRLKKQETIVEPVEETTEDEEHKEYVQISIAIHKKLIETTQEMAPQHPIMIPLQEKLQELKKEQQEVEECHICKSCDNKINEGQIFCSSKCYIKWSENIDPSISNIYNKIIQELEDEVEHMQDTMCTHCDSRL